MKYKTIQTLMLPDSEEENYGLYYQGTEGVRLSAVRRNPYIYRKMEMQIFLHILMDFTRSSGLSTQN